MSAAAVVIIISRPQNADPVSPTVDHQIIGEVSGLSLSEIVQSVADEIAATEIRPAG